MREVAPFLPQKTGKRQGVKDDLQSQGQVVEWIIQNQQVDGKEGNEKIRHEPVQQLVGDETPGV